MTRLLNSRRDFGRSYYCGNDLEKIEPDRADFKGEDMNRENLSSSISKEKTSCTTSLAGEGTERGTDRRRRLRRRGLDVAVAAGRR